MRARNSALSMWFAGLVFSSTWFNEGGGKEGQRDPEEEHVCECTRTRMQIHVHTCTCTRTHRAHAHTRTCNSKVAAHLDVDGVQSDAKLHGNCCQGQKQGQANHSWEGERDPGRTRCLQSTALCRVSALSARPCCRFHRRLSLALWHPPCLQAANEGEGV